ncbi:MAG TPA: ABC transporter ATP-binding protein [Streptosporangiaceae bacterium]|nr:ABC transporter ATP-binding protein [Streptosporangiaceae bacterium]
MERDSAIELVGLSKVYGRGQDALTAVDSVTLSVPEGQVIGLLGPNGAGKTTTIKMMASLIEPTSGRARLNGFDVSRQRSCAVLQIGAVLEGSRNVYWTMSPWQNLMYFGRLKGLPGPQIKPRAERLLTELGLWERRNQTVGTFSRGMQQKVAIAVALITDPPIILLDEPTLGLDVEAARTVKEWIRRLAAEGKTVVLTTHQLAVTQELANRIAVIRSGKIIADLPTAELLASYAEDQFQIVVAGPLNGLRAALPSGAEVAPDGEVTRVTLPGADTGALHKFLGQLEAAQVPLISVTKAQPDLEEIFIRLIRDGGMPAVEAGATVGATAPGGAL